MEGKPKTNAKSDMVGPSIYTEELLVSSQGQNSPTILQRGPYTLAANVAAITLPRYYVSSATANITFFLTGKTDNPVFQNGVMSAQAFGQTNLSSISGFYISGSGTDTGWWLVLGYK